MGNNAIFILIQTDDSVQLAFSMLLESTSRSGSKQVVTAKWSIWGRSIHSDESCRKFQWWKWYTR